MLDWRFSLLRFSNPIINLWYQLSFLCHWMCDLIASRTTCLESVKNVGQNHVNFVYPASMLLHKRKTMEFSKRSATTKNSKLVIFPQSWNFSIWTQSHLMTRSPPAQNTAKFPAPHLWNFRLIYQQPLYFRSTARTSLNICRTFSCVITCLSS